MTNMKMAFSGLTLILLRITYTNCPTVKSPGTKYLQNEHHLTVCNDYGHAQRERSQEPVSLLLVDVRDLTPLSLFHNDLRDRH